MALISFDPETERKIAELKNVSTEEVVRQTEINSRRLYGLPEAG